MRFFTWTDDLTRIIYPMLFTNDCLAFVIKEAMRILLPYDAFYFNPINNKKITILSYSEKRNHANHFGFYYSFLSLLYLGFMSWANSVLMHRFCFLLNCNFLFTLLFVNFRVFFLLLFYKFSLQTYCYLV